MKRRILAIAAIATFTLLLTLPPSLQSDTPSPVGDIAAKNTVVTLTVDYGDGVQKRFPEIPWRKAMTVQEALSWADRHPRGIDVKSRGTGATMLINQIDDLKNGGSTGKNWVYRVNGKLGDKSCAIFPVKASDQILWRFEAYP